MAGSFAPVTAPAQPATAPDPLMALMQSQPSIVTQAPKQAVAVFDPPVVRVGEEATYRITVNALMDSISLPENLPAPSGLILRPSASGQVFRQVGNALLPNSAFNHRARSDQPGTFILPEFTVQAYNQTVTVPAARLEVVPANVTPPQTVTRLQLELPMTNLFAGQAIIARVRQSALDSGAIQGLTQVELIGDGILVDRSFAQQRIESRPGNGTNRANFIHDTMFIPLRAGNITVAAQGFESGSLFGGAIVIPGDLPGVKLVDSDPVTIAVRPLPKAGELPGFTGGIGSFTIDPPTLTTNRLRVGEAVRLTVTVRGRGNLGRLLPPTPTFSREWQVLSDNSETPPALIHARGFVTFNYLLIPMTTATQYTPELPFSFFDPTHAIYVDLTIPSLRVTVMPGTQPTDTQALARAELPKFTEVDEPILSDLAPAPGKAATSLVPVALRGWFPLVQVAPVFGFVGLWAWERRRRYLEAHPEIVVHRRARRALRQARRELQAAVRKGDAARLLTAGLKAMRVAAAPHYPAEPRALVGTDVLALLTEEEQRGTIGTTVRQLFATADAARYGGRPPAGRDVLAAHADIQSMLNRLEAMLCR